MRLVKWTLVADKGALRGFATVELPIGLKIIDCPVFAGRNGLFASVPMRAEVDGGGRRKTDVNGKPIYAPVIEWRDRAIADCFSAAVIELVQKEHPDDLECET